MKIQFLYYEDCPSHDEALERLQQVLREEGLKDDIEIIRVETEEQAQAWKFVGSPTILVDGQDIVSVLPDEGYYLSCRVYQLEDGRFSPLPSLEMIRKGILSGLRNESAK
jgi:hypothetical protein